MKIDSSGILCSAKIDSNKACYTFSSFVSLSNGSILATARVARIDPLLRETNDEKV